MKKKKFIFFSFVFVFLFVVVACNDNANVVSIESLDTNTNSKARISASGGLRLRVKPNKKAKSLNIIPDGSLVIIIEVKNPEIILGGRKGKWTKIEWFGQTGWVFGAFLVPAKKLGNTKAVPKLVISDSFQGKFIANKLEVFVSEDLIYIIENAKKEVLAYCLADGVKRIRAEKIVVFCNLNAVPQKGKAKLNFKVAVNPDLVIMDLKKDDKIKIGGTESLMNGVYEKD